MLTIRVFYPLQEGRIVLHTEADWDRPLPADHVSEDRTTWTFRVDTKEMYFYYKPCIEHQGEVKWSEGNNFLAIAECDTMDLYPYFHPQHGGSISDLMDVSPRAKNGKICQHLVRFYYPPGYFENTLKRYPVLYMHDGNNLFFPYEAFMQNDWNIGHTMSLLDAMNIIRRAVIVGIYPVEREYEYTLPGYHDYGEFIVDVLKKEVVDKKLRVLSGARDTAVMGSSLGGVVSLFLAWEWPEVFGMAACMSSTFTFRDNLRQRIEAEPRRNIRIYLDSGWPGDNYEVTRGMRDLLLRRGYKFGRDLMYFAFPEALHSEQYWAMRSSIPFQFFFGESHAEVHNIAHIARRRVGTSARLAGPAGQMELPGAV